MIRLEVCLLLGNHSPSDLVVNYVLEQCAQKAVKVVEIYIPFTAIVIVPESMSLLRMSEEGVGITDYN